MYRIILNEELMNYSMEEFKTLISSRTKIKLFNNDLWIALTGKEIVVPADGGELYMDNKGQWHRGNEKEPAGIRFQNKNFVSVRSIEKIEMVE